MKYLASLSLLVMSVLFTNCDVPFITAGSCPPPLKGRIVSTTNPCAGVAIQIVSENLSNDDLALISDPEWNGIIAPSGQIVPYVFQNVFKIYPCDLEHNVTDLLAYDEVAGEFLNKGDFYFYITSESTISNNNGCSICKPLVSLPKKRNEITLNIECRDVITIVD